jgi:hypothetical protein
MEFAIVAPVFLGFLFFIFEIAYDTFLQEVLETTLEQTAHEVQIGDDQNIANGATFVTNDFCVNDLGLLNCNSVYLQIDRFNPSVTCPDLLNATTGTLPATLSAGTWNLELNNYFGTAGAGTGGTQALPSCDSTSPAAGFCNVGPDETIIMSAVYIAPSFLTAILPKNFRYTYGGNIVRAPFATTAFQSEIFPQTTAQAGELDQC